MEAIKSSAGQNEKRNLLSSIFVTILLGIAFQEMIAPARESFRAAGPTLGLIVFLVVFFVTALRFFIGAQLHLLSDNLLKQGGKAWFFDFAVISVEMIIMAFMGGVASPEASQAASITFFGFLASLLGLDVLWIVAQWAMGLTLKGWKRAFIPWTWAGINTGLLVLMSILLVANRGPLTSAAYLGILTLNIVAFAIDVFFTDYYNII